MWSGCSPKSDDDLKECEELGKNLSRMSQPTILCILAEADGPMHGYRIVKLAAGYPMFGGRKPDAAGIYRTLKRMEEQGLLESSWDTPDTGTAKRMFSLTEKGRLCLRRWIDALACYCVTIQELRQLASDALGIDLPDTPVCGHVTVDAAALSGANAETGQEDASQTLVANYDANGEAYYLDENGNAYYLDGDGNAYYYDEYGDAFYLDSEGNAFYYDEEGTPYYYDEDGNPFYYDEEGTPHYYYDEDGTAEGESVETSEEDSEQ